MDKELHGIAAAPGIALGTSVWWRQVEVTVIKRSISASAVVAEIDRLTQAVQKAAEQIELLKEVTQTRLGKEEAAIFEAHLSFLSDPTYVGEMGNRIRNDLQNADYVCSQVTEEMALMLSSLPDEYLRARSADIQDVGHRLVLLLSGKQAFDPTLVKSGSVVVADELTPSDTIQLPEGIVAMVTKRGSKTGHAAIMARTLGIPMVVGLGEDLESVHDADVLIVNGSAGQLVVNPDANEQHIAMQAVAADKELKERAMAFANKPAMTKDGHRIQVFANIGGLKDVKKALAHGAEGVGLFRTEFLYLENIQWPTEDEQFTAYREVVEAFSGNPVVIRTLDIGGDKELPYTDFAKEENPFLGHRAIRFCLANKDIFKTQLRALLRASVYGDLWIMFPMIENVAEILAAKQLLSECRQELAQKNMAVKDDIKVGIMIEIPAAAVMADILAKYVDFMSIGTNDLTQYTLAADRGNELVAPLYDAVHPAVLRLIAQTCKAANDAGIVVGMCGELAGDATMTEVLLGLGLKELSMSASMVPAVKERLSYLKMQPAIEVAEAVLKLENPSVVKEYAAAHLTC